MSQELMEVTRQPTQDSAISRMIDYAMQQNADIEKLERLFALKVAFEKDEARKAYVAAMVEFKKNPPEIFKTSHVKFGNTEYDHATIGDVTSITAAALAEHGISHRWDVKQGDGKITVQCILTHQMGHSEQVEMTSAADQSGGKNAIQAVASALTYMQRYTLLSATGLATKDQQDDDGRGAAKPPKDEPVVSGKRKKELGETAEAIRDYVAKDDDWAAFELYEPITDSEEKLYIWPLLPSNCRSALKRCATEKEKLAKSGETLTKESNVKTA